MKTVKIKFVGFWKDFDPELNPVYRVLKKHYDVRIVDDPDYIICSMFGEPYAYCHYPQVRIMFSGENYIPDLNLVDYAVCPYPVSLLDRCYFRPGCVDAFDHCVALQYKDRNYPETILESKPYFANFIASHESEHGLRGEFFEMLSAYKRVESPGSYLHNTAGEYVNWTDSSKTDFQRKCKFTLCFESTKHAGFVTEKITDAFYSDTIPVYYGSDTVTDIFNPKAFINCSDYPDLQAVMTRIIELDQNDELYLQMLRQPIFVDERYPQKVLDGLEQFVCHIFDQPLEKAYRRSRVYTPQWHNDYLCAVEKPRQLTAKELLRLLARKLCGRG